MFESLEPRLAMDSAALAPLADTYISQDWPDANCGTVFGEDDRAGVVPRDGDLENVLLNEEFASDPAARGWTGTDPNNVRWDSEGFLRARVNDETGVARWAYSPLFPEIDAGSFEFQWDMRPASTAWGTYPSVVLVQQGTTANPYMDGALRVEAHWCDGYPNQFLIGQSQDDPQGLFGLSPTFDANQWYRHTLTYNAHDQTLIWQVIERDSGAAFHTSTFTGVEMDPFNQVAVGYQGVPPVYGSWAEIYVDNIRLSSEVGPSQAIEFVTIGDPGNAADVNGLAHVRQVGL